MVPSLFLRMPVVSLTGFEPACVNPSKEYHPWHGYDPVIGLANTKCDNKRVG